MTHTEIQTRIRAILLNKFHISMDESKNPYFNFSQDGGMDSLDETELVMKVEDELKITLPSNNYGTLDAMVTDAYKTINS